MCKKRGPVPVTEPSVPLTGALFYCLIVGHSPGFNCVGPRGASKNIGLGRTTSLWAKDPVPVTDIQKILREVQVDESDIEAVLTLVATIRVIGVNM